MAATVCIGTERERARVLHWAKIAPIGTVVRFLKPKRTIPQNDRMWAMLTDVSKQAHHNGKRYTPEQWKALFCHACGHEVVFMQGLNDEPFPAGFKTSQMNKEEIGQMMDFIECWGAEHGVNFMGDA